ncbi:hypothetical protein N7G274_002237 [Stereocaulon virgatum]|uniref:Uncharacterized protein n=1 Tax=Stereocaulon virgatum TaxID=373712 RepID=A0ABR4AJZ0_9LECA
MPVVHDVHASLKVSLYVQGGARKAHGSQLEYRTAANGAILCLLFRHILFNGPIVRSSRPDIPCRLERRRMVKTGDQILLILESKQSIGHVYGIQEYNLNT